MSEFIKGFKVFDPDWTCHGFKYEIGGEYTHDGDIELNHVGFHFCQAAVDCFNYCKFDPANKYAEIEAFGKVEIDGEKSVTNKIRIVREIPWQELLTIINMGKSCTGIRNTGDKNTGNNNTGHNNVGYFNAGDFNTGDFNTGNCNNGNKNSGQNNTGDYNTGSNNKGSYNIGGNNIGFGNAGHWNTGENNTGNRNEGQENSGNYNNGELNTGENNTGDGNTGYHNIGDYNTGNYNVGAGNSGEYNGGFCNAGNYNSGDCNTGCWNSGNYNTGFFNTDEPFVRCFNKPTEMRLNEFRNLAGVQALEQHYENNWWISSEDMSDEEKTSHPTYKTTGGYLKSIPYKNACRLMWERLNDSEKNAVKAIPNFDARIFCEITGIDVVEK